MKALMIINIIVFLSCNNSSNHFEKSQMTKDTMCNEHYDSTLKELANNFNPTSISLDRSISGKLDSFLLAADTNCLRKQNEYKLFIATILAKQFYYHVSVGHQGYDLQSMEKGAAKIIVEDFKKMAGYQSPQLEMLNSAVIMDFIKKDEHLKKELADLVSQIEKKSDEVDKLHHVKKT